MARREVLRTLRLRARGTPERTTSPLRATPVVSRTLRVSLEGTATVAAEAPASKGPAKQAIRIARTRRNERREPSTNI
jgi:hypothetical protein